MQMTFEQFEIAPKRTLSAPQERRLNRKHCCGDFGGGSFSTIESLIVQGYVYQSGKIFNLTEKASHYLFHHGENMPI